MYTEKVNVLKRDNALIIGLVLLIQTLIVAAIVIELRNLSDSILAGASAIASPEEGSNLHWGTLMATESGTLLTVSGILSILTIIMYFIKPDDGPSKKSGHKR